MMQRTLAIDLIDDCVFSARSATEGGHQSLDRIPGAALLGAAAGRLYARLDRDAAFAAFHSGRLRFGDGLPWDGRTIGYPMPLCWHHDKTVRPDQHNDLVADRVYNFLHTDRIERAHGGEAQPKQLRGGYVHPDGHWTRPRRGLRLKTAIDAATGRAAEGQLFGYDALSRGQRFAARIEADADFDPGLFEQVIQALSGEVLLGRSRSAEYGRARLTPIDAAAPQPGPQREDGTCVLWLLADLALADAHGSPTLTPDAAALGLPVEAVVWEKTFLRTRRYSPWNAARHGYDRERLVFTAGGVLTLRLTRRLRDEEVAALQAGIGLHREAGLGRVWLNPPLLCKTPPPFGKNGGKAAVGARSEPPRPDHPLLDWLERQANVGWKTRVEERARELAEAYHEKVLAARRLLGIPEGERFGPSKAQWGDIFETARTKGGKALYAALFEESAAVVRQGAEGWQEKTVGEDGRLVTLAEWLKKTLEKELKHAETHRGFTHLVRQLAHRVRDDIERRRA